MADAKNTLEEISSDPDVRAIAYKRETALRGYYHTIAAEREESEARGRVEGRVEGQRETLTRLLSKRFGPLPSWAAERIAQANVSQIDSFLEELLTASTLEQALHVDS